MKKLYQFNPAKRMLQLVSMHRHLVIMAGVLGALMAALFGLITPFSYSSQSIIEIGSLKRVEVNAAVNPYFNTEKVALNKAALLIRSSDVLDHVAQILKSGNFLLMSLSLRGTERSISMRKLR